MKFRVLHGQHIQRKGDNDNHTYQKGEVVDSDFDLTLMNGQGMTPKFERLDFAGRATHPLGEVFDPTVETIDQFAERMRAKATVPGLTQPAPSGDSSPLPPGVPPGTKPPRNEAEYMKMLQGMTVKQLQEFASHRQIDLKGMTNKDAIIKTIRQADNEE